MQPGLPNEPARIARLAMVGPKTPFRKVHSASVGSKRSGRFPHAESWTRRSGHIRNHRSEPPAKPPPHHYVPRDAAPLAEVEEVLDRQLNKPIARSAAPLQETSLQTPLDLGHVARISRGRGRGPREQRRMARFQFRQLPSGTLLW